MQLSPDNATVVQSLPETVELLGDLLPHMLWLSTPEGQPIYQNAAWSEYTGLTSVGVGWREALAHPDDTRRLRDQWALTLRERLPFNAECRFRRHDGAWHWFLDRMAPVRDHDGAVTHWIGTLTDVDPLKNTESELTEAMRGRDEYLAALGHGLRTPLQALRQALYVLKLPDLSTADATKMHQTAESQILEIKRFCEEVLDVNQVRWDAMSLTIDEVNVQSIVDTAVATASPLIQEHGHSLDVRVENPGASISVDRVRLTQALINLLDNAAKYTDRRGRIVLSAGKRGRDMEFVVEDSGRGIDAETLPHIFELFARGALTSPSPGFGIGLALVRQVAILHGGVIDVHSDGPGRGSRFSLRIPMSPSPLT